MGMRGNQVLALFLCPLLLGYCLASPRADSKLMIKPENFIIGADVSSMQQYIMGRGKIGGIGEKVAGAETPAQSVKPDWSWIDRLREGGLNYIRLRIFVDPEISNGHERAYSTEGFCDLEHTIEVAREVKARGMHFLLNFHYSGTWADPGKQWKPVAWNDLHGKALEQKVYDYTRDAVQRLTDAGTKPDMVQVGNEIINGMLWPDGRIERYGDYTVFANLLKAGIRGVREVDSGIKIMVHLALGGENHRSRNFLDRLIAQGVKFDIIGQSYYTQWHGTMSDLRENLVDLATRYDQPIIVVEYGGSGNGVRDLHDLIRALPRGKGIGTFIFGGEGLVFDFGRKPQGDRLEVYRGIARDYSSGKNVSMRNISVRTAPPVASLSPIFGVNVSKIPVREADSGPEKDPFRILADQDVNIACIGVTFAEKSISDALLLARRAGNAGMRIMVVMHYSDDYTRLGRQAPPDEWKPRLEQDLEATLFQYTRRIIARFREQGTPPDLVQIGNEISDGFLLPKGVVDLEGDFGGLVRVGSAGARDVSPNSNVILSIASAGDIEKSIDFLYVATATDTGAGPLGGQWPARWIAPRRYHLQTGRGRIT
jgi:arabinogalactan endo-1,4-beta-galactosidase